MLQDDIFRLLLIVLLLANDSNGEQDFKRLNEILIICMLLGSNSNNGCGCNNGCRDNCGCNNNRPTSF